MRVWSTNTHINTGAWIAYEFLRQKYSRHPKTTKYPKKNCQQLNCFVLKHNSVVRLQTTAEENNQVCINKTRHYDVVRQFQTCRSFTSFWNNVAFIGLIIMFTYANMNQTGFLNRCSKKPSHQNTLIGIWLNTVKISIFVLPIDHIIGLIHHPLDTPTDWWLTIWCVWSFYMLVSRLAGYCIYLFGCAIWDNLTRHCRYYHSHWPSRSLYW